MTCEQLERLHDEWRQCMNTMWQEQISMDDYNKAHDRIREIERIIEAEEQRRSVLTDSTVDGART